MCETHDLGVKWPLWHTLIFEGDRSIDMRCVCPKDVKKMLLTALLMGKNREVAEMAKKVMKKLKEEVEKKGFKLSVTKNWEGRKEQDDCVVWLLGGRAASMQ